MNSEGCQNHHASTQSTVQWYFPAYKRKARAFAVEQPDPSPQNSINVNKLAESAKKTMF